MIRSAMRGALCSVLLGVVAMVAPALACAASVTEFTTGVAAAPGSMVNGSDGNVWFINGNGIAKIDSSGHVTTYGVANGLNMGGAPYDLTDGPNSDLWFTDQGTTKAVGYITPSGAIHEYAATGYNPLQVVAGSDGNVWFYSSGATHYIVKMTPGGTFSPYAMPTVPHIGVIDDNMVLGPDGDIWFADKENQSIGKISTAGVISEYSAAGSNPTNVTVGPDGNIWFSDNNGAIGRVTPVGAVQEFSTGLQSGGIPDAITAGPDGNVWFTDQYANNRGIGRITPSGQITEFTQVNGLNPDLPLDITAGADGNLWVPQASMGSTTPSAIAQITTSGQITEITSGVHSDGMGDGDSILAANNGSLWFTDGATPYAIGQIVIAPAATTGAASSVSSASAFLSGTITPLAATTTVTVQYGTGMSLGTVVTVGSLPAGTAKQTVTTMLTGLPADTTIYYRIVATNSAGVTDGAIQSFATAAAAPLVSPPLALQSAKRRFADQQITMTTPSSSACIANTSTLAATLASVAIRNSRKAKLRFSIASLFIGRGIRHTVTKTVLRHGRKVKLRKSTYRPNATIRKLPAAPKLKLAGLRSGQQTLKARLSYKQTVTRRGRRSTKTVTTSLTAKFDVC